MKYLFKVWLLLKKLFRKKSNPILQVNETIKKIDLSMFKAPQPIHFAPVFIPRKHTVCTYANQKRNAQKRKNILKHS